MSNPAVPERVEPVVGSSPAHPTARAVEELKAAIESTPPASAPAATTTAAAEPAAAPPPSSGDAGASPARGALDQLSRIEDKVSRIEEKYARTEFVMQRVQDKVETAMGRMNEVALQSDLVAMRNQLAANADRLRRVPGFGALLLTGIVTAMLAAGLVIAALRYVPGLLAP